MSAEASTWRRAGETGTYLDGLIIKTESIVFVGEEFLDLGALVTLELNHFAHTLGLGVANDGAIASCGLIVRRRVSMTLLDPRRQNVPKSFLITFRIFL